MQNEQVVDVATRRKEAREWARADGETPRVFESPEPRWWHKYFTWERLTLATGRTIEKGWVVPQPLGIALLVIMLGGVGSLYWRLTDKVTESDAKRTVEIQQLRELVIRMDQSLQDKSVHDNESKRKQEERLDMQDLKLQDVKDKLLVQNRRR